MEAGVDFTMADIDMLSRRTPVLCKVAPNSNYHMQDVNRAGGIMAILGELAAHGLLDTDVRRVDGMTLGEAITRYTATLRWVRRTIYTGRWIQTAPTGVYVILNMPMLPTAVLPCCVET